MRFLKYISAIIISNVPFFFCFGQNTRYIGIEEGLSNNTVTAVFKDHNGLMWFGTVDGLNQYDGYSFKKFKNKYQDTTTLPDDNIICINSDASGNLLVGTQNGLGVLGRKDLKFSQVYVVDASGKKRIIEGPISSICRDSKNKIFAATRESGFLEISENLDARQIPLLNSKHSLINSYTATAALVSRDGAVWTAVEGTGLCKLNLGRGRMEIVDMNLPPCSGIAANSEGNLFLGTNNGLYFYDIQHKTLSKVDLKAFSNAKINGLIIDKLNKMYLATDGQGVVELDGIDGQMRIIRHIGIDILTSNSVYTVFEDELSRKWIGTLRGGIDVIDPKINQFQTVRHIGLNPNSLVSDFTFSFCEDRYHHIWIGTDGGGLSIWDKKANLFENHVFESLPNESFNANYITSIIKDSGQNMWLSTYGPGVLRYDYDTRTFKNIPFLNKKGRNPVWKLAMDHENVIWAASSAVDTSRLFYFSAARNCFIPAPFHLTTDIISIANDGKNGLWLGTFSGLLHVDKKTGVDKSVNLHSAVRSLHYSASGMLWIGTYGRGLFSYEPDKGILKNFTEKNGLCDNKVLNIEEDKSGGIWMSTYNGISKFDPVGKSFENFYAADGLQSNQFYFNASTRLSSGELIFGGIKGFNIFNPENIHRYHDFSPLIITGIRVANTLIDANSKYVAGGSTIYNIDHIRLPYDKAIISLEFAALEYSLPDKIQYAYKLEGRDKGWNYLLNQRTLNYTQLDAGTYTLKIRCTNSSGIWSPKVKLIRFTVIPPWYRTWWAYLLYLLFIASILGAYLIYHYKQTKLKFEMKLIKEVNEKKLSFFTNISHELRTPLTLILNPIKELLHSDGKNLDLIDLSTVYRNSRRLLSLVDQLLLFKSSESEISAFNPGWMNITEACNEVFLCFNNQVKKKRISYEFLSNNVDVFLFADREKIDIVLFNLLSNAIKYTSEDGTVRLSINEHQKSVDICIRDTGKGISPEAGDKIFEKFYRINQENGSESGFGIGLYLAHRYMEVLQGELTYTSELGKGTEFRMILPKPDKPYVRQSEDKTVQRSTHIVDELIGESAPIAEDQFYDFDQVMAPDITPTKQTVLLIDDDTDFRTYLKKILYKSYAILEAEDVDQGFDLLLQDEPDIIVCDVLLKGTSGVEFCSKIKESPSFSHIPVILLTGSSSPEIKLKGIECGADDYITKPFEKDLLIARIKSMLKGRVLLKKFFINEITLKQNQFKIPAEYSEFINKCIVIVEQHLQDDDFGTKQFTAEIGMSRSKLFRNIKAVSGLTIVEFIRYIRLRKAGQLMMETDLQIKEISYRVGFSDQKYFREQFNKLFKMNPSEFVNKYKNSMTDNKAGSIYLVSKKTDSHKG
ncbi:two-component regulator propeller domain-containing protein [Mucilaginibacter sp. SJ]|uniref:two-component regulator propeller domain-containing protein n=1 Tax=Mucilaginibacter sp. SJ TaxID=3029053 RepID=UPI0023A951C9|nr:two-component regulator propeller domain-containing protein [Mucilaginibacter sp. SJ]WEA00592.1 two-component regulator propeller domain-containing protein [Mucilaginibacter sp. SJ]